MIPILGYHRRCREGSIIETHSARNLIDNAKAFISRFCFYRDAQSTIFEEYKVVLFEECLENIFYVWRWWHGVSQEDKLKYKTQIEELKQFSIKSLKPIMYSEKSHIKERIVLFFLKYNNSFTLAGIYYLNQLYRWIIKERGAYTLLSFLSLLRSSLVF